MRIKYELVVLLYDRYYEDVNKRKKNNQSGVGGGQILSSTLAISHKTDNTININDVTKSALPSILLATTICNNQYKRCIYMSVAGPDVWFDVSPGPAGRSRGLHLHAPSSAGTGQNFFIPVCSPWHKRYLSKIKERNKGPVGGEEALVGECLSIILY